MFNLSQNKILPAERHITWNEVIIDDRLCIRKKDGCNSASGLSVNWAAVLLLALATGNTTLKL
jgi:hypothetical protein